MFAAFVDSALTLALSPLEAVLPVDRAGIGISELTFRRLARPYVESAYHANDSLGCPLSLVLTTALAALVLPLRVEAV